MNEDEAIEKLSIVLSNKLLAILLLAWLRKEKDSIRNLKKYIKDIIEE